MPLTDDIKPCWLNPIRRLQSMAGQQKGYAILEIKIVVDEHGNPVFWTEPTMTKIEPQSSGARLMAQIISGLHA
jgi:hypothetical protein